MESSHSELVSSFSAFSTVFRQVFDATGTLGGQILEFAVVPVSFRNATNIHAGWEQALSGQSDVAGEERCSEDGKVHSKLEDRIFLGRRCTLCND
jgi:hypothetical protein